VVDLRLKKIQDERQAVYPNEGLIIHWEAEIAAITHLHIHTGLLENELEEV
jgi:hypothetical protein